MRGWPLMMRREPKPAARLAARDRLGEGAAPEALGRDGVVEGAHPDRLVGRAPLRLRVEVHHAAGEREALHREAAPPSRSGPSALRGAPPPSTARPARAASRAWSRGRRRPARRTRRRRGRRPGAARPGCPRRSARPWSRPRTPAPCRPAAARPAPPAPAARRRGRRRRAGARAARTAEQRRSIGTILRLGRAGALGTDDRTPHPALSPEGRGRSGVFGALLAQELLDLGDEVAGGRQLVLDLRDLGRLGRPPRAGRLLVVVRLLRSSLRT